MARHRSITDGSISVRPPDILRRSMEFQARKFARRVLITHLALLVVVLGIVSIAARVIYGGARRQAVLQAEHTQRLLAKQTALGIQNYYESVTSVLNLLQPTAG